MKKITKIAILTLPLALAAVLVLPVLAQNSGAKNKSHAGSKPAVVADTAVNAACVQSAVEKRDAAVMAAVDSYAAAAKSALSTRKDAEKSAWNQTDRKTRGAAMRAATVAYRTVVRTARKDFRNARQSAWRQFRTDRKTCGGSTGSEEFGGQGQDESL